MFTSFDRNIYNEKGGVKFYLILQMAEEIEKSLDENRNQWKEDLKKHGQEVGLLLFVQSSFWHISDDLSVCTA